MKRLLLILLICFPVIVSAQSPAQEVIDTSADIASRNLQSMSASASITLCTRAAEIFLRDSGIYTVAFMHSISASDIFLRERAANMDPLHGLACILLADEPSAIEAPYIDPVPVLLLPTFIIRDPQIAVKNVAVQGLTIFSTEHLEANASIFNPVPVLALPVFFIKDPEIAIEYVAMRDIVPFKDEAGGATPPAEPVSIPVLPFFFIKDPEVLAEPVPMQPGVTFNCAPAVAQYTDSVRVPALPAFFIKDAEISINPIQVNDAMLFSDVPVVVAPPAVLVPVIVIEPIFARDSEPVMESLAIWKPSIFDTKAAAVPPPSVQVPDIDVGTIIVRELASDIEPVVTREAGIEVAPTNMPLTEIDLPELPPYVNPDERMPVEQMHLSEEGYSLLQNLEGFAPDLYSLNDGGYTIGFGFFIPYNEGYKWRKGVTLEQATELMQQKVPAYEDQVKKYVNVPLTQNEFDALTLLAYNLGGFSKATSIINDIN